MSDIVVPGLTPDDKDPGFYGFIKFGVGKQSVGGGLVVTLFGNKTSAGAALVNSRTQVFSKEDAAAAAGGPSELARMAYAALDVDGAVVNIVVVAEASGGVAATATITIGGSWSTSGQATFQLDEEIFIVNFSTTDSTVTLAAVEVVTSVNQRQQGRLFCTAGNSAGVVTLTTVNVGVRNNQHTLLLIDKTLAPVGMTIAIAGGTALANGGVPFTGGTGTDDITAAITAFDASQLDYVGLAHNDATNLGLVETHANAKLAASVQLYDQYVTSSNGTLAAATALAQTQMNDQLGQLVWVPFGVEHPSRIAARMAAFRSVNESIQPNTNYNGVILPGASPHVRDLDSPTHPIRKAALDVGITPMMTVDDKLVIVRCINSHSLNGTTPDDRTLDSSDTTVPIRIMKELKVLYAAMRVDNPFSGPDLTDLPPPGRFTPNLWRRAVDALMKDHEADHWVTDVDNHPTVAQWDDAGNRVVSATPSVVELHNNQVGALVNQVPG